MAKKKSSRDADVERVRGATRRLLANPAATPEVQLLSAWLLWEVAQSPLGETSVANSNLLGELKASTPGYEKKGGSTGDVRAGTKGASIAQAEQRGRVEEEGHATADTEGNKADGATTAPQKPT